GARRGTRGLHGHVVHRLVHVTQADLGFAGQAEPVVFPDQAAVDADALEDAVVAVQAVGVDPGSGGGRGGVVGSEAPVVTPGFAVVDEGVQAHAVGDVPFVVQVDATAAGQEPVIGRRVAVDFGVVLLQEHAAVRDVGVVAVVGILQADPLVVAQGHAGLGHHVGHVVTL